MSKIVASDPVWQEWLTDVMASRPSGNTYLDSPRGLDVAKLCLDFERDDFNWHRSDDDTFWLDIQMFVKYKLDDDEIRFICHQQPGVDNYKKHSKEKNAYAEMKRGLDKLKEIYAEEQS